MSNGSHSVQRDDGSLPAQMIEAMIRDAGKGVSTDDRESDQSGDVPDPLNGPAFGPTFLELVLQCIIAAHPVGRKTDRQRLDAAMTALTGAKSSGNPFSEDKDDQALLWMKAREIELRSQGADPSDSKLARAAAEKFQRWSSSDGMTIPNRLREKFSGVYQQKQYVQKFKRSRDAVSPPDIPRTLAYRAMRHDYLAESVERQMLTRIVAELRQAGVAATLPDD